MQDFQELQQAKAGCLKDITEALPRYSERLAAIDQRLTEYVEDAISGNASHARSTSGRLLPKGRKNIYVLEKETTNLMNCRNYDRKREYIVKHCDATGGHETDQDGMEGVPSLRQGATHYGILPT